MMCDVRILVPLRRTVRPSSTFTTSDFLVAMECLRAYLARPDITMSDLRGSSTE